MTDLEVNEFDSAVRMTGFAAANNDILRNNTKVISTFVLLDADIATLESAGAVRVSAKGLRTDGTTDRRAAKAALYALVRKIANTATTIKKEEPDFANQFKLGRATLSYQELLDAARAFKNDFAAATDKFAEFGLSNTMSDNLEAKINSLEAAGTQQNTGKGNSVAATAQTKASIARLKKNRRTLTTIVRNILEELGDEAKLAEWKSACRVERAAQKKKDSSPIT